MKKLRLFDSLKFVRFVVAVVAATLILNVAHADNDTQLWKYTPLAVSYHTNSATVVSTESDGNFNTYTVKASPGSNRCLYVNTENSLPANHKYFINVRFKSTFTGKPYFRYSLDGGTTFQNIGYNNNCQPNTWCNLSAIITPQQDWSFTGIFNGIVLQSGDYIAGETITIDKNGFLTVFDLTEIFGAGNEPATAAAAIRALSIDTTIKIATTKYNEEQFEPVQNRLSDAMDAVDDVVTRTMTQAQAIDQIANEKQTRPDEGCLAKYCLLVEDEDGTPHWYPIAGANGVEYVLPSGYTQLEYIESNGSQYINTGIYATQNTAIETKFINLSGASATSVMIGDGWSGGKYQFSIVAQTGAPNKIGGLSRSLSNFWTTNKEFIVQMNKTGLYVDGELFGWSGSATEFTSTNPLTLLGDPTVSGRGATVKLFYMKIYENDTMVRNFIPAKNASDVVGMYDTVSGQFFTKSGNGDDFTSPDM